jgi:hypothetical protein
LGRLDVFVDAGGRELELVRFCANLAAQTDGGAPRTTFISTEVALNPVANSFPVFGHLKIN